MKLEIRAVCDMGNVRTNNEDIILIGDSFIFNKNSNMLIDMEKEKTYWAAVADGMGGYAAGEIASRMTVDFYKNKFMEIKEEPDMDVNSLKIMITKWTEEINTIISKEGEKDQEKQNMGTTFNGILFISGLPYSINIGDSRLYRLRNGFLQQISKDHSLSQVTGISDVRSNLITNSIGGNDKVFVDVDLISKSISSGDVFLLCSDGLSGMVDDDTIENVLNNEESEPEIVLLNKAKDAGGEDNISIIIIKVKD